MSLHTAFIAKADQAYAEAQEHLDTLIDALVSDMSERDAKGDTTDSPYWASSLFHVTECIADLGKVSDDLIAVYTAAVYRLARNKIAAQ